MNLKQYIETSKRGTAKALATDLCISQSYLSQLASGAAPMPPEMAVQIEKKTQGGVTRQEMFPERWKGIWPELDKAAA